MGPAGFTLAHHLLNDGHTVVGIDGLKIEPLAAARCRGSRRRASACRSSPSSTPRSLNEPLDDRVMAGFGGVAEYGITVRWDKNFLKIIRLLLERRDAVRAVSAACASAARSMTDGAFALGFDHVAARRGRGPADGARACRTASPTACAPRPIS